MGRDSFARTNLSPGPRSLASTGQHVRHNDVARPKEIVDPGHSMNVCIICLAPSNNNLMLKPVDFGEMCHFRLVLTFQGAEVSDWLRQFI